MKPVEPIHAVELFAPLSEALLALLRDLSMAEWARPTACAPWTVKDVAAHLLGGNFGRLSAVQVPGTCQVPGTYDDLVAWINDSNAEWVHAARRISPELLIDLLALTDRRLHARFRGRDAPAPAGASVAWAGQRQSPNWFDIAREYTEKWLHQQHIREAVGRPLLTERRWLHPVLDTFVRGLPHAYRGVEADEGVTVAVRILGEAGGEWSLRRQGGDWRLYVGLGPAARCTVSLSQDIAWRLFTRGMDREAAETHVEILGDARLEAPVLELVAIMA